MKMLNLKYTYTVHVVFWRNKDYSRHVSYVNGLFEKVFYCWVLCTIL